jgi:hypothetical protein
MQLVCRAGEGGLRPGQGGPAACQSLVSAGARMHTVGGTQRSRRRCFGAASMQDCRLQALASKDDPFATTNST